MSSNTIMIFPFPCGKIVTVSHLPVSRHVPLFGRCTVKQPMVLSLDFFPLKPFNHAIMRLSFAVANADQYQLAVIIF